MPINWRLNIPNSERKPINRTMLDSKQMKTKVIVLFIEHSYERGFDLLQYLLFYLFPDFRVNYYKIVGRQHTDWPDAGNRRNPDGPLFPMSADLLEIRIDISNRFAQKRYYWFGALRRRHSYSIVTVTRQITLRTHQAYKLYL